MPKNKQEELSGMPKTELVDVPLDGVGKAAQNFKTALEKVQAAIEDKGETMDALFKALVRAKRTSIQVSGFKFERQHTGPKDSIKVTKAK